MIKENFMIDDDCGKICVHYLTEVNDNNKDKPIVILCHGITYSSIPVFDIPIMGKSFCERIVELGYIVFMPDYFGYGSSFDGCNSNITLDIAISNVKSTITFIRNQGYRGKIFLLGWSWGAQIVGHYITKYNRDISAAILYGYKWHISLENLPIVSGERRINSEQHLKEDFNVKDNILKEVLSEYINVALKIDPTSPNSPREELLKNKDLAVNPHLIDLPVLIIHGHEDSGVNLDDNMKFFKKIRCSEKQYAVIYGAHPLHLERTYNRFINIVNNFINLYL